MAYPGSQLYRDALARDWPLPSSWDGYSQHSKSCLPLPTKLLSGAEVLTFRDAAFVEYFDRPEYRDMVLRMYGQAAADEIGRMLGHTLERDHRTLQPA